MKPTFDRIGARPRHAIHSLGTFHAKSLILVEQWKNSALNKEIKVLRGARAVVERNG
jgi:hypothetical protein